MFEICPRFVESGDAIEYRGGAAAEAGELGKDEPHPVALLRSGAQFGQDIGEDALLCVDKALQIVRIGSGHAGIMSFARPA